MSCMFESALRSLVAASKRPVLGHQPFLMFRAQTLDAGFAETMRHQLSGVGVDCE